MCLILGVSKSEKWKFMTRYFFAFLELMIEMIAELTQSGYVDSKVLLETIENNDLDIYEIMNELRGNF